MKKIQEIPLISSFFDSNGNLISDEKLNEKVGEIPEFFYSARRDFFSDFLNFILYKRDLKTSEDLRKFIELFNKKVFMKYSSWDTFYERIYYTKRFSPKTINQVLEEFDPLSFPEEVEMRYLIEKISHILSEEEFIKLGRKILLLFLDKEFDVSFVLTHIIFLGLLKKKKEGFASKKQRKKENEAMQFLFKKSIESIFSDENFDDQRDIIIEKITEDIEKYKFDSSRYHDTDYLISGFNYYNNFCKRNKFPFKLEELIDFDKLTKVNSVSDLFTLYVETILYCLSKIEINFGDKEEEIKRNFEILKSSIILELKLIEN